MYKGSNQSDGTLRIEVIQTNEFNNFNTKTERLSNEIPETEGVTKDSTRVDQFVTKDIKDTSPVGAFLQGKNCLNGGTGWWKYEFCYGRVRQYDVDKNGEQSLILGFYDEAAHIEFIKSNPHKKPKPATKRTQLTHFYQGSSSLCDKTVKRRQTEVKLKCLDNASSSFTVLLYFLEPQTCQYMALGVESPLICDILSKADENALVTKEHAGSERDETLAEYVIEL